MKRILKYLSFIPLIGLFSVLGLIIWIITTEAGLQYLVTQAQQYTPGHLTITEVTGRINDAVSITGLTYQHEELAISVEKVQIAWQPRDLLKKTLHIARLYVDNLAIALPKTPASDTATDAPITIPSLYLPFMVKIDAVDIKQVTITRAAATPIIVDSIHLTSVATPAALTQRLAVTSSLLNATVEGTVGLHAPHPVEMYVDWSAPLPHNLTAQGRGHVRGNTHALTLTHELQQPVPLQLHATVTDVLEQLRWSAQLQWPQLQWPLLQARCAAVTCPALVNSRQGRVTASGTLQEYNVTVDTELLETPTLPAGQWTVTVQGDSQHARLTGLRAETLTGIIKANGDVRWHPTVTAQANVTVMHLSPRRFWAEWPSTLSVDSQLTAQLANHTVHIESLHVSIPMTPMNLTLRGDMAIADKPSFQNTVLTWANLQWPLVSDNPLVTSAAGQIDVRGSMEEYHAQVNADIAGIQIPRGQWAITGHGNLQQFTVDTVRTEILQGVMTGFGRVQWSGANPPQPLLKKEGSRLFSSSLTKGPSSPPLTKGGLEGVDPKQEGGNSKEESRKEGSLSLTQSEANPPQPLLKKEGSRPFSSSLTKEPSSPPLTKGGLEGVDPKQEGGNSKEEPGVVAELHLNATKINPAALWPDAPPGLRLNSQLVASFDATRPGPTVVIKQFTVQLPETSTQLALTGHAILVAEPQFQATVTWKNAQWPLVATAAPLIASDRGTAQVNGTLTAYQVQLTTDMAGKDIPAAHWQLTGQGDSHSLQTIHLHGKTLQGQLNLNGHVTWQPALTWQATVTGNDLNLGSQWPQLSSQLALEIRTHGHFNKDLLDTSIDVRQFQGLLSGYPLAMTTQVRIQGQRYHVQQLNLVSGKNQLTVKGVIDKQSQIEWMLNVPTLASLVAPVIQEEIHGNLRSHGRLTGALTSPRIQATLTGEALRFQNQQLAKLKAILDVNLRDDMRVDIEANDYQREATHVKQLRLHGQGRINAHTVTVNADVPENRQSVSLQVHGGYDLAQTRWQGILEKFQLATGQLGTWQLRTPVPLEASPKRVDMAELCLQNPEKVGVCAAGHWQAPLEANLNIRVEETSLRLLRPFLPPDLEIEGRVKSQLTATLLADGSVRANADVTVTPGYVKSRVTEDAETLTYMGGQLNVHITDTGLAAAVDFKLLKNSVLQGSLQLPRLNRLPLAVDQPLQGQLQFISADLPLLPTLVPALANTRGTVRADVTVGGTLESPKINGQVQLQQAAMEVLDLGLTFKEMTVSVTTADSHTAQLLGQLQSGQGVLKVTGAIRLMPAPWQAHIDITGDNVEVANIPVAWVLASPRLRVDMAPQRVDVTGEVTIPEAAITLSGGDTAEVVTASEDVVIVNSHQQPPVATAEKLAITSRVKVKLGDKVTFKGMGFSSHIGGAIIASSLPYKETTANGELQLLAGTYKAYGQNLKVERGRIIFTGGPVDNPGLDIRAFRRIRRTGEEDIMAGIQVQGTAQSPQISLFSIPTLDQTNTLSYILLGKPAASATSGENQALLSAASALPFSQGESMVKKISDQLGFDEASLSSEGSIEETALVVGKYLSPRLYVSYGIGLFDNSSVFRIRYELSKQWRLETETGTQSGIDLRYTLEQ